MGLDQFARIYAISAGTVGGAFLVTNDFPMLGTLVLASGIVSLLVHIRQDYLGK